MLRSVKISDNMITNPITMKANGDVYQAIQLLLSNKVSGLCVIDEKGTLVGVLSELDCLKAILSSVYNKNPVGEVGEYMTKDVISVKESDNIVDVASDMLKFKHRRRPVIDAEGKLIGQVTCRQLLSAVNEFAK